MCGRDALDVVASPRPDRRDSAVSGHRCRTRDLLRVVEPGVSGEPDVLELVTADFDPDIDPAIFRAPPGSLRAGQGFGEMLGGRLAGHVVKTVAGLAAGCGLGAWIRHGRQLHGETPYGPDSALGHSRLLTDLPLFREPARAAGPVLPGEVLALLGDGVVARSPRPCTSGPMLAGSASAVPASARRSGFGGLGYLMDAVSESAWSGQAHVEAAHGRAHLVSDRPLL